MREDPFVTEYLKQKSPGSRKHVTLRVALAAFNYFARKKRRPRAKKVASTKETEGKPIRMDCFCLSCTKSIGKDWIVIALSLSGM